MITEAERALSIHIQEAEACYGTNIILSNISLQVYQGERILVTGPNGSGKSTLLKLLSGNLIAQRGKVEVLGNNLAKASARQLVRRKIGILTQIQSEPQIAISVQESVLLGLWGTRFSYLKRSSSHDIERARHQLALVDMLNLAHRDIRTLSGGQRQRVALARALIRDPQLVLMDEPTTYLDSDAKVDILKRIEQLQRQFGFASIIVSHEPLSSLMSDRTIHIENRQLHAVQQEIQ